MPRYKPQAQNGACATSKNMRAAELQFPDGLRATYRQNEETQRVITCHQEVHTMAVLIMVQQPQPS